MAYHREKPVGNALEQITNQVLGTYYDLLGDVGRYSFSERVLPLARNIFKSDPALCEAILVQLIDTVSFQPVAAVTPFWQSEVDRHTFRFQKQFENLRRAQKKSEGRWVFHLNTRDLLENLEGGQLRQQYLRNGQAFDISAQDGDSEYYDIFFADGSIDELALYFAGQVSLARRNELEFFRRALQYNNQLMPRDWAIVAAESKNVKAIAANQVAVNNIYSYSHNAEVSLSPLPQAINDHHLIPISQYLLQYYCHFSMLPCKMKVQIYI